MLMLEPTSFHPIPEKNSNESIFNQFPYWNVLELNSNDV